MSITKIEYVEKTLNIITGCNAFSAGCKNCYARIMSKRLQAMGQLKYKDNFEVRLHPSELEKPNKWKKPCKIFINSMSDTFHKEVPTEFIKKIFKMMNENPQHTFLVLTKRAERLFELHKELEWTPNIWMGVSVENSKVMDRIDFLRETDAKTKFLSLEPLLGALPNMNLLDIDWAIVGGESGPKSRPIEKEWVEDIQKQCKEQKTAFFFKQWGGKNKKKAGRLLNGKTYDEMPTIFNQST